MEYYKKVFIKSADDLPEYNREQQLICQLKSGTMGIYANSTIRCDWEKVEFYLQPTDLKNELLKYQDYMDDQLCLYGDRQCNTDLVDEYLNQLNK